MTPPPDQTYLVGQTLGPITIDSDHGSCGYFIGVTSITDELGADVTEL